MGGIRTGEVGRTDGLWMNGRNPAKQSHIKYGGVSGIGCAGNTPIYFWDVGMAYCHGKKQGEGRAGKAAGRRNAGRMPEKRRKPPKDGGDYRGHQK